MVVILGMTKGQGCKANMIVLLFCQNNMSLLMLVVLFVFTNSNVRMKILEFFYIFNYALIALLTLCKSICPLLKIMSDGEQY